jgi:CPA1 family monovalent cation:H+ antiporter
MTEIATIVRILTILLLIALLVILITRRLSIPYTLGLVVVGLGISLLGARFNFEFRLNPDLVLFVFLPALIFEGAWSTSVEELRKHWVAIFFLIGPGLLLELVLIALPLHYFAGLSWYTAFLLSAILSPTDPIAVLGLFRQLHVQPRIAAIIEGESLLNDGVAGSFYQVFLILTLAAIGGHTQPALQSTLYGLSIFVLQAGGGVVVGGILGFAISFFVKHVEDPLIETTITLVTAYAVYLLADAIHASGLLATIMAGLILGSYGRSVSMSEETQAVVDDFWSLAAFIANALLFLLVGLELNPFRFFAEANLSSLLLAAGAAILAVLLSRLIIVVLLPRPSMTVPGMLLNAPRVVIFWSGLRGALSMALVLALPLNIPDRETLVFATYAVILFSLLVQGFSLRLLLKSLPSVSP